ncbi:MAG: hypothetical protein AB7O49_14060 [Sphingomonadales bacterium]
MVTYVTEAAMKGLFPENLSVFDPGLLCKEAAYRPLNVFLCGPGYGTEAHTLRSAVRDMLTGYKNVRVTYGEEIDPDELRVSTRMDLQTLESSFAHNVDFTVLMLDSPGAMAELGTFSMIDNVRPRLYILVSSMFFGIIPLTQV